MIIHTSVHQYVHNVPVFGLVKWFSGPDRCQDVSNFIILLFILIDGDGTVPSVVPGDS